MYSGLIQASLDEPTQSVVMHRTEPSRIQSMSLQLADKLANLVDNNERILKIRQGTSPIKIKLREIYSSND